MSAQIAAYGRLGAHPQLRTSASGKPWATASIAVNAGRDSDGPPLWLQVVAIGAVGETLCRHEKGDLLSVSGRLQFNRWSDREGAAREQLQVVAETVVSARTVRPIGGSKRQVDDPGRQAPASRMAQGHALDDGIPFAPGVRG